MRKIIPSILIAVAFILPAQAQISSYDELEIEEESVTKPFAAEGSNFVYLKSRRGTSGMNKTDEADAITGKPVTKIVLVFTELNASDEDEREDANRERWDNLIMTYPEFFQENTVFKGVCQCNPSGDAEGFKSVQGFYIYYKGPQVTQPAAPKTEPAAAKTEPAVTNKTEPKTEPPVAKSEPAAEEKKLNITEAEPVKQAVKEPEPVKESGTGVAKTEEATDETEPAPEPVIKKKKPSSTSKPRRARDPKACRPACYQGGDEDLRAYFSDKIQLSKKQRRKAKNAVVNVRLQIHFDGKIKKTTVTGNNEVINKMVEDAVSQMDNWNPSVKNGVTIKSDVRLTLKFDKESKTMKPTDVLTNPKSTPKCRCVSDSELFD